MNRRDDSGRFTEENTDTDVLAAVKEHEPAATSEVAEELEITRQGAEYRLKNLTDEGEVNRKKIGTIVIWWVNNTEEE